MHPATTSIKVFGVYVMLTGLGLALAPALALAPLGLAAPLDIWVRVLGAVALALGYYYWQMASVQAIDFFKASLKGRALFAVVCLLLVLAFSGPWQLLVFGGLDVLGALWTAKGLRQASAAAP